MFDKKKEYSIESLKENNSNMILTLDKGRLTFKMIKNYPFIFSKNTFILYIRWKYSTRFVAYIEKGSQATDGNFSHL